MIHLVRVDDEQYRQMEQIAIKQRRSVTKELSIALENHVNKNKAYISNEPRGVSKEQLKGAIK